MRHLGAGDGDAVRAAMADALAGRYWVIGGTGAFARWVVAGMTASAALADAGDPPDFEECVAFSAAAVQVEPGGAGATPTRIELLLMPQSKTPLWAIEYVFERVYGFPKAAGAPAPGRFALFAPGGPAEAGPLNRFVHEAAAGGVPMVAAAGDN